VRLRLLALERSLRATGCDLPLLVIPFDERRFDLPANATWWTTGMRDWLVKERTHAMMFKYQCLNTSHYQYVDSDVIFLRNPEKVLAAEEGFITSCSHWHNFQETVTAETVPMLKALTTCWQRNVFNAGQFACDRVLYSEEDLKRACLDPRQEKICLRFPLRDQPALNLLVNQSGVSIYNLTLPPTLMESTWAGDYVESGYEDYWRDEKRKPYLIHWAGCDVWEPRAVDQVFTQYLTAAERKEWNEEVATKERNEKRFRRSIHGRLRATARVMRRVARAFTK
jgi:lipopolysaccharide biosynthesis glycosyltransferase